MAMTKVNFYIGTLAMFSIIIFSMLLFATDINTTHEISPRSEDYISDYAGYVEATNLEKMQDSEDKRIIEGTNETGESSVTDFLANINYFAQRAARVKAYVDLVYNLPSFMVSSLGLPINDFKHIINILGIIIFMALVVVFIRLMK